MLPLHEACTASWNEFDFSQPPEAVLVVLQETSRKELYGDLLPVEGRQRRLGWVQARTIYLDKAIHDVRALLQLSSLCIGLHVLHVD